MVESEAMLLRQGRWLNHSKPGVPCDFMIGKLTDEKCRRCGNTPSAHYGVREMYTKPKKPTGVLS